MASANDIAAALHQRAGAEVTDAQVGQNQLRLQLRVPLNGGPQWVLILHRLLVVSATTAWKVDLCKKYVLRRVGNQPPRMVYTWRLIFEAKNVEEHIESIVSAIGSAPHPARPELQEFPLAGAQRNHANGKGAYSAETTPMVAHMANAARMGGGR